MLKIAHIKIRVSKDETTKFNVLTECIKQLQEEENEFK